VNDEQQADERSQEEPDLSDERYEAEREVRDEDEDEDRGRPRVFDEATSAAEHETEKLQRGRKLPFFAGPLPIRALLAMLIFVLVFVVVWLILWAALGTLGIAAGWIVGAAAGLFAVKLAGDRLGDRGLERPPRTRPGA
jgi:hypothetical protein